jgi:GNAT superfamily N-acetyltransferase
MVLPTPVRVRPPRPADAPALAEMAGQLGYPTDAEALLGRLAGLHPTDAAVMVAVDDQDLPIGWCHVELRRTLIEERSGMVLGLVVADGARSTGVGHALLAAAEDWSRARGCDHIVVATRITRERAHQFYAREGYQVSKTSYFLVKPLDRS